MNKVPLYHQPSRKDQSFSYLRSTLTDPPKTSVYDLKSLNFNKNELLGKGENRELVQA